MKKLLIVFLLLIPLYSNASLVEDVFYYSGLPAKPGYCFMIQGRGFADGDQLLLNSDEFGISDTLNITLSIEGYAKLYFPKNLQSGSYNMTLYRGNDSQEIGSISFQVVERMPIGSKVIAHRGHWRPSNASQNSRASLRNAIELGVYGSEVDVWLTTDGHIMCNHDESFQGVSIQNATYEDVQSLKLENGETMSELSELLQMLYEDTPTKLIIEIKHHSSFQRNCAAVDSVLSLVRNMHLEDKVEYISFNYLVCQRLAKMAPYAYVSYLYGDMNPEDLSDLGITGLDYTLPVYRNNINWIKEAEQLSLTTDVWTVDKLDEIIEVNNMGIDYITTDNPERALDVYSYYTRIIADSVNTAIFKMYKGKLLEVKEYLNNAINVINQGCLDVASSFLVEEEQLLIQIKDIESELEALYKREELNSQYTIDVDSIINSIDDMVFRAKKTQNEFTANISCYGSEESSPNLIYSPLGVRISNHRAKGVVIIKKNNRISKKNLK